MRGHCEKEVEFEVDRKGCKVDMSGEGSFLGKRNSTNRGTEMREYMLCRRAHGCLVCLQGRVTGRREERTKDTEDVCEEPSLHALSGNLGFILLGDKEPLQIFEVEK